MDSHLFFFPACHKCSVGLLIESKLLKFYLPLSFMSWFSSILLLDEFLNGIPSPQRRTEWFLHASVPEPQVLISSPLTNHQVS